jgi:quinol monooxygenase YgiN
MWRLREGDVWMYGTIAKMRIKPGKIDEMQKLNEQEAREIPGILFQYVYQMDADPGEYLLVVGFESREAYKANAESPEMHQRYLRYRELLDAEPEWHDGEIAFAITSAGTVN